MRKLLWIFLATVALAAPPSDPKAEKEILAIMESYKDAQRSSS